MANGSNTGREAVVTFGGLDENAEIVGGENYIGELPPAGKALPGQIRRIFLTDASTGDAMFKVLYEVTEGPYTGFTAWDNVTLNNRAAFKWQPLLKVLGITAGDLKSGTRVDAENVTDVGRRVTGIGPCDLSGDNSVPCYFGVQYRSFDGIRTPHVVASKPRRIANVDAMDEFKPANDKSTKKTNGTGNGTTGKTTDDSDFVYE